MGVQAPAVTEHGLVNRHWQGLINEHFYFNLVTASEGNKTRVCVSGREGGVEA